MKPQNFAILTGCLLVAAVLLMVTGNPRQSAADRAAAQAPSRVITVVGEAEVHIKPDLATVTFGVLTTGASATEAEALSLASAKHIQAAMIAAGVDEQGLESAQVALTPVMHQDFTGVSRIAGYQAKATIRGTVRKMDKVQPVVDAALAAGASSLEGVVYWQADPEQGKENAMAAALDNARKRAAAMAQADGDTLGELRSMEVLPDEAPPAPAATPGTLVFRARVRATFAY